jgi:hypothetical protein
MVELPRGVHAVVSGGRTYFYYHPGRGTPSAAKRQRLPDDPRLPDFWSEYARLSGQVTEEPMVRIGTFDALIGDYKSSPEFLKKAPRTKKLNDGHFAIIADRWGSLLVKGVRPRHVLELRDSFSATPRKADQIVALLSVIIAWGIPREYAEANPCREIGKLSETDGWHPWQQEDIDYAKEHLRPHLWWAAALALYTGQRQSDVLQMDWSRISGDEIAVRQMKTGKFLWIPLHRELRQVLETLPRVSTRILTNSGGLPWASGFKASWQAAMNVKAFASFRQRRLVFHGLRKSAVVMLLEAGCTDAEVAAITGQSREMIAHYSLMVNQRKLARAAILKWEGANGM